jgi:hypothetical protein
MNTFGIIQTMIPHNVKDPHSKALEPDCLSPRIAITTQPLMGEGAGEGGTSCVSPSPQSSPPVGGEEVLGVIF